MPWNKAIRQTFIKSFQSIDLKPSKSCSGIFLSPDWSKGELGMPKCTPQGDLEARKEGSGY